MTEATTAPVNPSLASPAVLNDLLNSAEVRAVMTQKVDAEIKQVEERLIQLKATRESLISPGDVESMATPAPRRRGPVPGSQRAPAGRRGRQPGRAASGPSKGTGGRPRGPGPNHVGAILDALKGKRNGLTASEIWSALEAAKHPGEKKTIMTYLSKMSSSKDNRLISSGEHGSYRYSINPTPNPQKG